jgi:IclR family transcriptional regulator, KDG regulon repressor
VNGAIGKSVRVLEALATARGPIRLSTLADELVMQKSTVHRVLGELIELGYAEQDASGLYRPTLRMWELGVNIVADLPIRQVASSALVELHDTTGETVSLVVRSGDDALYLDKLISARPMRFTTRVGSRIPLPVPAGGKAILAFSDDGPDVVARLAKEADPRWAIDEAKVLRAMGHARRTGFVLSSAQQGVKSVAAPILDRDRRPVGALSVSAPTELMEQEGRTSIIDDVVATATRLSDSLGRL